MVSPLSPAAWVATLRREWGLHQLVDPAFRGLWHAPPPDEWVALHCATTGRDAARDEIVAIAAVRIVGERLLTSQRLELVVRPQQALASLSADSVRRHGLRAQDLVAGLPVQEALRQLLHFIGPRPLVGYYLDFDLAVLNRAAQPLLGVPLPQPGIDVSALFHDWKFRQLPPHQQQGNVAIDLRFATLLRELGLPERDTHDALGHAVMAGLAFIKLRQILAA